MIPAALFVGEGTYEQAGRSVAAAGDVDGDGYDDLLVGAVDTGTIASSSGVDGLQSTWLIGSYDALAHHR